jgi:hypothetical protein
MLTVLRRHTMTFDPNADMPQRDGKLRMGRELELSDGRVVRMAVTAGTTAEQINTLDKWERDVLSGARHE